MKKASAKRNHDDLRSEYDLSQLKGGVRGKYYREATAGTNLVLIEPELANVFPDAESVNRALRLLADTAESAVSSKGSSKRSSKEANQAERLSDLLQEGAKLDHVCSGFEYLENDYSLEEFLECFPSVTRDLVRAVLESAAHRVALAELDSPIQVRRS